MDVVQTINYITELKYCKTKCCGCDTQKIQIKPAILRMDNSYFKFQHAKRIKAVEKLEHYLLNPGRFSILLLGLRGTGKSHWLQIIQDGYQNEEVCLNGIVSINASLAQTERKYWNEIFEKAHKKLLVIDNVEKLSTECQDLLLEGLSTEKGANYGFDKKEFNFRLVCTSTFDVTTLRDTEEHLSNSFFDRIAQLVVQLPSYQDIPSAIWNDFLLTWNKMSFMDNSDLPGDYLKVWLEKYAPNLHGNFRDLDKIAINWHQYRLMKEKEENILKFVRSDFNEFIHFPEHRSELPVAFYIEGNCTFEDNLKDFRRQYKKYLVSKYGTLRKGEKEAGKSYRSMERW